jgi:tRNA pseudouridine38/39 synthase
LNINEKNINNKEEKKVIIKKKEELEYLKMLNSVLPEDIRIIAWSPVDFNFNARFSCDYRTYKYYFLKEDLDLELIKVGNKKIIFNN